MNPTKEIKNTSNWRRLIKFFFVWILLNILSYSLIVLPIYPEAIQLSRENYEDKNIDDTFFSILIQFSILIGTLLSFWYMKEKVERIPIRNFIKLNLREFYNGIGLGVILIFASVVVMWLGNLVSLNYQSMANAPILILMFIMVAVTEEVICRGYLLNNLLEKMPSYSAILISSLLFSLMHLGNPHFGLIGFFNIFLSGVLMAILYLRSHNLGAPIGFHFSWNLVQALFGFAVSGRSDMGVVSINFLSKSDYLTGGKFGVEGSILLIPIVLVSIFLLSKRYPSILKEKKI